MSKIDLSRQVMSHDTLTGVSMVYYRDPDGTVTIRNEQEVLPVTEMNRQEYNDAPTRWNLDGFNKVASIPLVVLEDLKQKGILNDEAAFKRWLNDGDNRFFRTRPGVV